MNAGIPSKSVEELLALQANYEARMVDSGHALSHSTATVMSQRMREIHLELKKRRAMTTNA